MTASNLRYQLPKRAIKTDCPQCGPRHRKTLSRYIDTRTDELLTEEYGRCDRESNCGYHLSPYHKVDAGLSYADRVYQQWKQDNPLPAHQTGHTSTYSNGRGNVAQSPPPKPQTRTYQLPDEVYRATLGQYDRNQFAKLLQRHCGNVIAEELLLRFRIGTSSRWPGASVFWLVDEKHRARAGQVVLFADDWHKARYVDHEQKERVCISSVSHGLLRRYRQQQQPVPDWLADYHDNAPRWPILFGLHQLAITPADQPVAVVEAPKTAVLCTPYFPAFVWMAVGALSYLNAERMAPLRNRRVVLFPDLSTGGSAFARWSRTADELRQQGFSITVSDYLEQSAATDQHRQDGFDLADYLTRYECPLSGRGLDEPDGYPALWDVSTGQSQCA